jgi:hypothetical protein
MWGFSEIQGFRFVSCGNSVSDVMRYGTSCSTQAGEEVCVIVAPLMSPWRGAEIIY